MIGNFYLKVLAYLDENATNDPQQTVVDIKKFINVYDLTSALTETRKLTAGEETAITLPADPMSYLYLETNTEIIVKIDSDDPGVTVVADGIFFLRSSFTTLIVSVPGESDATVTIFASA